MSLEQFGTSDDASRPRNEAITGEERCGTNACVGTMLVRAEETGDPYVAVYDTKIPEHVEAAAIEPPISAEGARAIGMLCFRTGDEWPKFTREMHVGGHQYATTGTAG